MGVHLRFGTAGATGGGFSAQPGSLQPHFEGCRDEPRWNWQARGPKTWKDPNRWYSLWSFGVRVSGASLDGEYTTRSLASPDLFEPFSCDGPGTSVSRFLVGTCVDGSDVAVADATVQVFRTSDDFYLGQDVSRSDGKYYAPADVIAGVQLYAVAYKVGSPDIGGTTVNTLTNTLVDGT